MFTGSTNDVFQQKQHKRRIVRYVEQCIPDNVLDLGVNVMVIQHACKIPGCVPLETVVVVIFPLSKVELLPGLKESRGGSYKTKILKPLESVEKQDVLESLPSSFKGGLRSMEKICTKTRDVMFAQLSQIFADEDHEGRRHMAEYLIDSLNQYIDRQCVPPPEWTHSFSEHESTSCGEQSPNVTVGDSLSNKRMMSMAAVSSPGGETKKNLHFRYSIML